MYWVVECFFYLDFFFNWFVGFKDIEHHKNVYEFKKIAIRYFYGWFLIDFMAIFPVQIIIDS